MNTIMSKLGWVCAAVMVGACSTSRSYKGEVKETYMDYDSFALSDGLDDDRWTSNRDGAIRYFSPVNEAFDYSSYERFADKSSIFGDREGSFFGDVDASTGAFGGDNPDRVQEPGREPFVVVAPFLKVMSLPSPEGRSIATLPQGAVIQVKVLNEKWGTIGHGLYIPLEKRWLRPAEPDRDPVVLRRTNP